MFIPCSHLALGSVSGSGMNTASIGPPLLTVLGLKGLW